MTVVILPRKNKTHEKRFKNFVCFCDSRIGEAIEVLRCRCRPRCATVLISPTIRDTSGTFISGYTTRDASTTSVCGTSGLAVRWIGSTANSRVTDSGAHTIATSTPQRCAIRTIAVQIEHDWFFVLGFVHCFFLLETLIQSVTTPLRLRTNETVVECARFDDWHHTSR